MVLTMQFKLVPTNEQARVIEATMHEYIGLVNDIIDYSIAIDEMPKLSSANIKAPLPSALRDQCRLDAKSIWKKIMKSGRCFPVLKKPVAIWNNQNYKANRDSIEFPVWLDGKSQRIKVKAVIPDDMYGTLVDSKLGTLRITKKNGKYIAQVAYEVGSEAKAGSGVMGVDLGIKCPAVAVMSDDTVRFYGNGRQNKFVRRRFAKRRKKLGKAKKLKAIKKSANKEQRWMKDQDHKISRAIVNDAIVHGVGTIKLETLFGIRASARTSRKNNHSLHSWSFYRLAKFIEYKAELAGIKVVYVDPAYTSQTCPICGGVHHAQDRQYVCPDCGYRSHRDIIGARNILAA